VTWWRCFPPLGDGAEVLWHPATAVAAAGVLGMVLSAGGAVAWYHANRDVDAVAGSAVPNRG
jgi:hypothetical protein